MSKKYRVILDTNVIVVAFLYKLSKERKLFDAAHKNHALLFSSETFAELQDVLLRPKFDRYTSKKKRRSFVRRVREIYTIVNTSTVVEDVRDVKDNMFISLAVDGNANFLITADTDFLDDPALLKKYEKIKICSVEKAVSVLLG